MKVEVARRLAQVLLDAAAQADAYKLEEIHMGLVLVANPDAHAAISHALVHYPLPSSKKENS
jgi:hypothetical protein